MGAVVIANQAAVELFDASGNPLAVEGGVAIAANTHGLLIAGNEAGTARYLRVASDGTVRMDPTGTTVQPARLFDGSGNPVTVTDDSGTFRLEVNAEITGTSGTGGNVKIEDSTGTYIADVTSDGRLKVDLSAPSVPAGTTEISDEISSSMSGNNYTDFNLPVGEDPTIQRLLAGSESKSSDKGSRVRLIYDQAGGGPVQELEIARLYVNGASGVVSLNFVVPRTVVSGDRMRIHRTAFGGGGREIYGRWEGYYP